MTKLSEPSLQRLLEFQKLLLQFQAIDRVVNIGSKLEPENDIEHSYTLAMTAWYLSQYFSELDQTKVLKLALAHDIIEVHSGDTFIYADQTLLDSKQQRETDALKRLQADWADFPEMLEAIISYQTKDGAEANFVYALDKIMPPMLIYLTHGKTWQRQSITLEMLDSHKRDKVALSSAVEKYYLELYELLKAHPDYFPQPKTK